MSLALDTVSLPVSLIVGASEPIELGSVDIPLILDGRDVGDEYTVTVDTLTDPLCGDVAGLLRRYADRLDGRRNGE